jgi:hypothetical protein
MIPGSWIDQADEAASIRAAYPGTVYPFEEDRELEEKRINKLAEMRKQTEIRDAVDRMLEIKCDSDAKPSER